MKKFILQVKKKFIFFLFLFLFFNLPSFSENTSSKKTVRVGYFELGNCMAGASKDAVKSGYAYDLLCEISNFGNWNIEFVYGSFSELLEMLEKGKIDVLPCVDYSDERAQKLLYTQTKVLDFYYTIAAFQNSDFAHGYNYKKINGVKIATVVDSYQNVIYEKWANENGIKNELVYCDSFDELWNLVLDGKADYVLNINTINPPLKILNLVNCGSCVSYFGVSKNHPELVNEIDNSIELMQKISPFMFTHWQEKYYGNFLSSFDYSENEINWLSSHDTIKVGGFTQDIPYTFYNFEKNVCGVFPDMLNLIIERMGINLKVEWNLYDTIQEMREALEKGEIDLIGGEYHSYYLAQNNNEILSEEIINVPMGLLSKTNQKTDSIKRIAVVSTRHGSSFAKDVFPDSDFIYLESVPECVKAVAENRADFAIAHTSVLHQYSRGYKQNFSITPINYPGSICFSVNPRNFELINLLNRGIHLIQQEDRSQLELKYIYEDNIRYTMKEFMFDNLWLFLIIVFILILFIVISANRIYTSKKLSKHLKEITEKNILINALSKSYFNVFCISKKYNMARFFKMQGFIPSVITRKTENYTYTKFINAYGSERVIPEDAQMFINNLAINNIVKELEENIEYNFTYRCIDNKENHYYEAHVAKLNSKDYDYEYICGLRNIDSIVAEKEKQKQALASALEDAQHANNSKTLFLKSMSHDIRTPMNAIVGFTSLAIDNIENKDKVMECLSKISTSSNHLLNLINDILDMSRIESGNVKLEETCVHLPDFLQDLQTILLPGVTSKNQNLSIKTNNLVNEDIYIDKLRLNQILLNICGNAIKYTPNGGSIEVFLNQEPSTRPNQTKIQFVIRDNGIGMSSEFQKHIFESFAREQTATVSGIQGTGLGMPIAKNIIDMMGGSIIVQSEKGKGSEFTVNLSCKIAEPKNETKNESQKFISENIKGKKILLAEDNLFNQEIAVAIIEGAGFKVTVVDDGEKAVNALRNMSEGQFDLVLMDVQMPILDGYTATREIRTLPNPEAANIPIIAMTANAFEEDRKRAFESGMSGFLTKPIVIEDLFKQLQTILQ